MRGLMFPYRHGPEWHWYGRQPDSFHRQHGLSMQWYLLQWTINIEIEEPEEEPGFEEQKQQAVKELASKLAISAEQAEVLVNNGYLSLDGLKEVSGEELAKIEELEDATLEAIDQALERWFLGYLSRI